MYIIKCGLCFLSENVCRLCFLLQTECRLYFLSSSDGWADVNTSITIVDSSSDGRMTSACPSLLEATVAMDVVCPLLLIYQYNGALVATGQLSVITMTYDLLIQYLFVVVWHDPYVFTKWIDCLCILSLVCIHHDLSRICCSWNHFQLSHV
jgi:hypothetical protein